MQPEKTYNTPRRVYALIGFYLAPVLVLIVIAQHFAIMALTSTN